MRKPNFFIIGAPKCGTTSLAAWLAEHPQVFFPSVKEPAFFNFDYATRRITSLSRYERLFTNANEEHLAVGEASVRYLYSRIAVPAIMRYNNDARFIVMIRNPVDMACALHEQTLFDGDEDEKDFERAWKLQNVRIYGDLIPKRCRDPQLLIYGNLCRLGAQIQQLFEVIPRERVLIVNLESLKLDARSEYRRILDFLNLEDDQRQTFPVKNTAKERRFPIIWQSLDLANRAFRAAGVPYIRVGLTQFVYDWARKERDRPAMSAATRYRLHKYFASDISLLEQLTGSNLSHWKLDERLSEKRSAKATNRDAE